MDKSKNQLFSFGTICTIFFVFIKVCVLTAYTKANHGSPLISSIHPMLPSIVEFSGGNLKLHANAPVYTYSHATPPEETDLASDMQKEMAELSRQLKLNGVSLICYIRKHSHNLSIR